MDWNDGTEGGNEEPDADSLHRCNGAGHEADPAIPKVILEELLEEEIEGRVRADVREDDRRDDEHDRLSENHRDEARATQPQQAHDSRIESLSLRRDHQQRVDQQNRDNYEHDDQDIEDESDEE